MIIRTKLDWIQPRKLTDIQKEEIEAKKEFMENYDPFEAELEEVERDAIIDTQNDKIYIDTGENKICLIRLLDSQFIEKSGGNVEKVEERLYFQGTLDNIYEELNNNK